MNLDEVPAMRAFFFFFLKFGGSWQGTAQRFLQHTGAPSLVWLFLWRGCVSGSALGRGAEGNGQGGGESCCVDAPGGSRGSRSADPGRRGASGSGPPPAPRFLV